MDILLLGGVFTGVALLVWVAVAQHRLRKQVSTLTCMVGQVLSKEERLLNAAEQITEKLNEIDGALDDEAQSLDNLATRINDALAGGITTEQAQGFVERLGTSATRLRGLKTVTDLINPATATEGSVLTPDSTVGTPADTPTGTGDGGIPADTGAGGDQPPSISDGGNSA